MGFRWFLGFVGFVGLCMLIVGLLLVYCGCIVVVFVDCLWSCLWVIVGSLWGFVGLCGCLGVVVGFSGVCVVFVGVCELLWVFVVFVGLCWGVYIFVFVVLCGIGLFL